MELNKILKNLSVIFLIVSVVACSSYNNLKNNKKSVIDSEKITVDAEEDIINKKTSLNEHINLQIQELKNNNIVYFDLDKYNINDDFIQQLDISANFLRNNTLHKVTIEGHADERGTPEYNIALGERRANSIKMYLQSKGVPANQIAIVSYGKEKPAVLGHNEEAYAKNRRAVMIY